MKEEEKIKTNKEFALKMALIVSIVTIFLLLFSKFLFGV
jgi:uncharacterized protein YqhQ